VSLDVEALVKMVGTDGARAALRASATVTLEDLRSANAKAGGSFTDSTKRTEIIDALLASFENHLTASLDALQKLSLSEIQDYFRKSRCSMAELELFLGRAKIPFRRGLTKPQLIADAARQIRGMGLYDHIAGGPKLLEVKDNAAVLPSDQRDDGIPRLEGIWYSDIGARVNFRFDGDIIEGTYRRPDDTENDLFGKTDVATSVGRPIVSLMALWDDGRRDAVSATAWVGYLEKVGGEEIIVMSWVRVEGLVSTSVGREYLRRRSPREEEVDCARKLLDAPYPKRRR